MLHKAFVPAQEEGSPYENANRLKTYVLLLVNVVDVPCERRSVSSSACRVVYPAAPSTRRHKRLCAQPLCACQIQHVCLCLHATSAPDGVGDPFTVSG